MAQRPRGVRERKPSCIRNGCHRLFPAGCRERFQSNRPSSIVFDDRFQNPAVRAVKPQPVDLEPVERDRCDLPGDPAIPHHLCEIPYPLEQAVGDAGRPPAAPRQLKCAVLLAVDPKDRGAAADNRAELFVGVKLEPLDHTKPVAQRGGELPGAGGRTDQGEVRQVDPDRARRRAFPDDDIQRKILHRRVENLLHRAGQPVDFIYKQYILWRKICE